MGVTVTHCDIIQTKHLQTHHDEHEYESNRQFNGRNGGYPYDEYADEHGAWRSWSILFWRYAINVVIQRMGASKCRPIGGHLLCGSRDDDILLLFTIFTTNYGQQISNKGANTT